jgi:hypothetical protein
MQQRACQARADLPHPDHALLERCGHQSSAVGRKRTRGRAVGVSLQDVELGGGFEVVHDEGAFGGADCEALGWAMKVNSREAVVGGVSVCGWVGEEGGGHGQEEDVRFNDVSDNFGRSVEHSVSARSRVRIERLDHRLHQSR